MKQAIVAAVGDQFYKITSEALLVTQQLVKVMRPLGEFRNRNILSECAISYTYIYLRARHTNIHVLQRVINE